VSFFFFWRREGRGWGERERRERSARRSQPTRRKEKTHTLFPSHAHKTQFSAALAGAIGNIVKLNAIFPPGTPGEPGEELSAAQKLRSAKNVGRGLLLAVVATFAGCALLYSFPDALASALGRSMPYWFYESEKLLLAAGSAVANWVITAGFR
jgi:hypothetical protein